MFGKPEDNRGNKTLVAQDFTIQADYGFIAKNLTITDRVTSRDVLRVTFENEYNSYYDVEYVVIDSKEYKVHKDQNVYSSEIEKGVKGKNSVIVNEVILTNGKHYNVGQTLEYIYLKDEPNITNIKVIYEGEKAKVSFTREDSDRAIKNITVYLTDIEGNVIVEKDVLDSQNEVEFDVDRSKGYIVKIKVTFDLADGIERTKEIEYKEPGKEPEKEPIEVNIISSTIDNTYVKKNENKDVAFTIKTNTDDLITAIEINGITLSATKNDDETYKVSFNTPEKSGKVLLEVTAIIFANQGKVSTYYKSNFEVLKSEPSITEYSFNYEEDHVKVTFKYTDEDDAKVGEAKLVIKDIDTGETVLEGKEIVKGENEAQIQGIETDTYILKIVGKYDLDETKGDGINEHEFSEIFAEKEIKFIDDYKLEFEIKGVSIDREKSCVKVKISCTNAGDYNTSFVVAHGEKYPVVKEEGESYALIPYTSEDNQEITITDVVLENGVELPLEEGKTFEIFKNAPTIENLVATNTPDNVHVTFDVIDEEGIMENAKVLIVDGNGVAIRDAIDINKTSAEVYFDKIEEAGCYTVQIIADYDRVDGMEHKAEVIKETSLKVEITANIVSDSKDEYVNKLSQVDITYTIKDNTDEKVSKILINETRCEVVENNEDTYKIKYTAGDTAGDEKLLITELEYTDGEIVDVSYESSIEVLKSEPVVSNFNVDTTQSNPRATFKLTDKDDSFISGRIIIKNTNTQAQEEVSLEKDKYEYDLNLEENIVYEVELEITFDLDKDRENGKHETTKVFERLENVEYTKDYKLSVTNLEVIDVDSNVTKSAKLKFKSQNSSIYGISSVIVDDKNLDTQKVEDEENTYIFEYPFNDKVGERQEIVVSSVVLQNNIVVGLEEKPSAVIFKEKPLIENVVLQLVDNEKIKVSFKTIDNDKTLKEISVKLKDEKDEIFETQELNPEISETEFNIIQSGKYSASIHATYDAVDGIDHIDEFISSSEESIEIVQNIEVTTEDISNSYPLKGETIEIKYKISSNVAQEPTKIVLNNGEEYILQKTEEDGVYKISYTVPNESNILNIKVTKVYFGESNGINTPGNTATDVIEVLKDIPSFKITSTDIVELSTVVFNIDITDTDNAFVSAKAKFKGEEHELKVGANTWGVQVEPDIEHNIDFEIVYDRDFNVREEDEDKNTGTVNETRTFKLISDYGFKINDMATYNEEGIKSTHFKKGEKIDLKFNYESEVDFELESISIKDTSKEVSDSIEYTVQKLEDESGYNYYVEFYASTSCGEQCFEVTSAKSSSTKVIPSEKFKEPSPKATIEVLKTKPTMSNYSAYNHENTITINFDILDEDNALNESYVKLSNTETNTEEKAKIVNGENHHTFKDLIPGQKYMITIENNYALCSHEEYNGKEIFNTDEIEILKQDEPNFQIRNLAISKRVPLGGKVLITFENSVLSYHDVDTVKINGIDCVAKKNSNNVYEIELEPANKGVNQLYLESAKIDDKTFHIDRSLSYTYEFAVPTAQNVSEIVENVGTGEAELSYTIDDPDNSIRKFTAYMKTSSGAIVATKELEDLEEAKTSFKMSLLKLNTYSIELRATCDIGDGNTLEEKSLFTKSKVAEPRVSIIDQSIDKEYVNKGEDVTLTFKINTNLDQEVKKIYVDDVSYNAKKVTDEKGKIIEDTYSITVEAPEESNVYPVKVTKIQIGTSLVEASYKDNPDYVKIKVFKDIPTLTHFTIDEENRKITFKINDKDHALVNPKPKFIVKENDEVKHTEELEISKTDDYELDLDEVKMSNTNTPYDVTVNVTYDQRPDAPKETIIDKIKGIFKIKSDVATTSEAALEGENSTDEEPEINYVISKDIYNEQYKLTGKLNYKLDFKDASGFYPFTTTEPYPFLFDCSTGTDQMVKKVIIDDVEYEVQEKTDTSQKFDDEHMHRYRGEYVAKSADQTSITYQKVILENGTAFDVNETVPCMVTMATPKFEILDFIENIDEQTARFTFKFEDKDNKLAGSLIFTLMDSHGQIIKTKEIEDPKNKNSIEFDIPYPPTSVYRLKVTGKLYQIKDYDDWLEDYTFKDEKYISSINTSILKSELSTKYPKQNETIMIDYVISSTKVIKIDKEDHSNQDKAVSISALTINGKDYEVQPLEKDEMYRVYYTAKDEPGIEEINVTQVKFSNGDVEEFNMKDKIEVLKEVPYITNFKSVNDLENGKIDFTFDLIDPDSVIGTNTLYACIGEKQEKIQCGENKVSFNVEKDKLLDFEVKATYDLDNNELQMENDDNDYIENTIFSKKVMLTGDYSVDITNIKTVNSKGEETKYFEKGEDIKLYLDCKTKENALYPEKITINGETYELEEAESNTEEANTYLINLQGGDKAEEITLNISAITLNSGNEVELTNKSFKYEILKDAVRVKNFSSKSNENNSDEINLSIEVEDIDNANKELKIELKDEYNSEVNLSQNTLNVGTNNITFKKGLAEKYYVTIYSTYNRSKDEESKENYHQDEKIHYQIVSTVTRYIEMKDIVDIKLFRFDDYGRAVKVDSLTKDNLKVLDNCLVEVTMKNIPAFYSKITSYSVEGNKLKLILAYEDAMVYTGEEELKPLEVTLDILESEGGYEYKGSFKSLVDRMRANPKESIVLDKDYDLSDYTGGNDKAYIDFDFKGTIDGNGHKITNLIKPLFNKLDGATIKNLVIDDVKLTGHDSKGSLAIYATNGTKITNVHIQNFVDSGNGTGTFVYELSDGSVLENSSSTNIAFNTTYQTQSIAGAVVLLVRNSKVENCYVQGYISSGWWRNGGLVAVSDNTSTISHNIINLKMSAYFAFTEEYGYGNGGIISNHQNPESSKDSTVNLDHNLSLVEGNHAVAPIYNFEGCSLSKKSEKNYQLDTAVTPNDTKDGTVETISRKDINKAFFEKDLKLDKNIWIIPDNASAENLPVLKGVSTSFNDEGTQPKNPNVYIPDYNRVSKLEGYNPDREITYNNMYKLMPFYDAKEIIRDGNKIAENNMLNTKLVKYIVPFNKEGHMVTYLTKENYNSLDKIYIVFEDGTKLTYHIDFDDYYGDVASYMITDLNIGYNYNEYILDPNQDIIAELIDVASKYDFEKDLAPLTDKIEEDSRLYKEHFEKYTKYHLREFVINALVNMGYTPHFESDVLDYKIRQELVDNGKLKELLFAYNYFTYWYNLDMDGINLADAVMFHSNEMFNIDMTFNYLASSLVQGTNSKTDATATFYNSYMSKYTKISNLGLFLDYYVTNLTKYQNGNDWFKANWHGGKYYEVKLDGEAGEKTEYTLWDHLLRDSKVQTDFLPLMSVPDNCMYVASSPTQAYFGSLRVYVTDPNDEKQMAEFEKKVTKWCDEVKWFYTFAYNYWGSEIMNKICDVNYDERFTLTGRGEETIYNNPLTTEEPYHKYFTEAVNRWSAMSGGAYANGNEVYWVVIRMFDNFRVGTHETLHNQDSKLFMNGYGRRGDAEDYAAGFLQQYYRDGWVSPNIFDETPVSENSTQNLRRSSVETDAKLQSFYNKYFRVNDFLDWIEAKAYFELTPEEQASISVKVSYPETDNQEAGDDVVAYTPLTTEEVNAMGGLDSMEKLWNNKIMLRPGVKEYTKQSPGADTDSIFNIHWYQPHADNNRPDGANFKYLAWQMAGEGGYYDGLCAYYSLSYIASKKHTNEKTTDLSALRYIMKDENITYEKYKLDRYKELSKHYDDEGTYVNAKEIYEEYLKALKEDAGKKDRNLKMSTAVKKKYFQQIRKETNDFNIEPFSKKDGATINSTEKLDVKNEQVVTNAEEFINKIEEYPDGVIKLNNNIDLSKYVDGESVISTQFTGTLDGNNYVISGNRKPLFNSLNGATVENIKIQNALISTEAENIGVLSKQVEDSTITNVVIENSTVNATDNVGGIAGILDNSILKNVHTKGIVINANAYVGGLAGCARNGSSIQETSVNAKVVSYGTDVGTFIGRVENSKINNCYAVGNLVNNIVLKENCVGGFVGKADSATLNNNFVGVDMEAPETSGGFIGEAVNAVNINNNLSLTNQKFDGYKFDGKTDIIKLIQKDKQNSYANNYELSNTKGIATDKRNDDISSVIITIDKNDLTDAFFIQKLQFSTEIWDLSKVNSGELPKLKNSDPNKPNKDVMLFEENNTVKEDVLHQQVEENIVPEKIDDKQLGIYKEEHKPTSSYSNTYEETQKENETIDEDSNRTVKNETAKEEEIPKIDSSPQLENKIENETIVTTPDANIADDS